MATTRRRAPSGPAQAGPVDEPATAPGPVQAAEAVEQPAPPAAPARPARRPAARPAAGPAFVRATRRLSTPDGGLAHVPGDLVPAQNVARNGWADGVEPV